MPRNKRYKKRNTFAKDNFHRFGKNDSIAIKALKMASNVKKALNVEYKCLEVDHPIASVTPTPTVANGQIYLLNGMAEGDGSSQRNGKQVEFKTLNIHGFMFPGASSIDAVVRVIIFKVKGANGGTPLSTEVLNHPSGFYTLNFYNLDNVPQNYQILADKRYQFSPEHTQGIMPFTIRVDQEIKTRYQGSTSANTDVSTNAVWALVVADTRTGANPPSIRLESRMRYVDN